MTIRKIIFIISIVTLLCPTFTQFSLADLNPGQIYEGNESIIYRNVTVYAPAVASTDDGYIGVISTITVTIQSSGSGRVFVDTLPLTEVDMQGSARLAVKVASALVQNDLNSNVDPSSFDYFFVVRTSSPIIGGPSAGGIMTVATISLLENWQMDNKTVMTGMINPDGSIGPIGGIPEKIDAANSVGAMHFLIPKGQGTYTEMVPTTVNGWITTVKPVTRNIADYAMENYGITVTEVSDITDAIENFTGYRFLINGSNGLITTEDYNRAMKPLSSTLLGEARYQYESAKLNVENASIPNNYPTYYKNDVYDSLKLAEDNLIKAEEASENETYYTSTSESFQSLIYSRFILYTCEYWNPDNDTFIQDLLDEVKEKYDDAASFARNAEIFGYISLQTVGAAQRRATEAKDRLNSAEGLYNSGLFYYSQVLDFLYNVAFIFERCNSIGWWLNIGSYFNETGELDKDILDELALEYIEEAQQATIYSSIILSQGASNTDSPGYLSIAENLLLSARKNLENEYPALAFFEALEATVRANLAIEIIGSEPKDKIDLARESANNNIARSRQQGIEPVLAVSYYEFAQSLTNDYVYDSALIYFKYGGMIAGALGLTEFTSGSTSSRYIGVPEISEPSNLNWLLNNIGIIISIAILAGIIGLGFGIIICSVIYKNKEEVQRKEPNKGVNEYMKSSKDSDFSKNDIPRSIKDYYKKQK
jgi:uncharacterized protein